MSCCCHLEVGVEPAGYGASLEVLVIIGMTLKGRLRSCSLLLCFLITGCHKVIILPVPYTPPMIGDLTTPYTLKAMGRGAYGV